MHVLNLSHKEHNEIKDKNNSINKTFILNGLLYFVSDLPEFIITLLLVVYADRLTGFCTTKNSCDLINELAQFFNIISISFQFYVFLYFNRNFSESFEDFRTRFFEFWLPRKKKLIHFIHIKEMYMF